MYTTRTELVHGVVVGAVAIGGKMSWRRTWRAWPAHRRAETICRDGRVSIRLETTIQNRSGAGDRDWVGVGNSGWEHYRRGYY
jgi:hypothetical protein